MAVLFTNVTALTMDPANPRLKDAFVAVEGAKILSVGTEKPAGEFERVIDCTGKVMLPGFVNAHTHLPMTLMRGYAGGHDLQDWLYNYIFPAEARWDSRSIRAAADLGLAEMIASGVTCVADMYMHTGTVAQAVLDVGISANLSCGGVYFGAAEDFSPEACGDCKIQRELTEQWHNAGDGQILVDASIHGEYTSCAPLWRWMAEYAQTHGLGMHVHISETKAEHAGSLERNDLTPIQALDRCGVWDCTRSIAAHCVYTTPEDWAIMAAKHVSAVHNPWSNLKLGSGIAPVPAMRQAGVNVALGTDGMSSHNSVDFFTDVKLCACLHNGALCDPMAVTAMGALETATVNGARALGRDAGVIAPGKIADLILVDFSAPNLTPCHDVAENLAFSACGRDVWMNMARGRVIYEKGEFLTLDLDRVRAEVEGYALPRIFG